jgi:hypothetical protein
MRDNREKWMELCEQAVVEQDSQKLVDCRRVTITRLLASNLAWPPVAKSFSPSNSIPS